ncbi:MAG TPA: hypothetical protein VFY61_20285 [Pyrinomonadaceae bacterium]|nr:hypothetical protein [Pyrinomonadaceae bacterium]
MSAGFEGFRYEPALLDQSDEQALLTHLRTLPFREFEFHGYTGKRRVVSFGWKYEFSGEKLVKADEIPDFLLPLRDRAASFAGLEPEAFQHALVTEYGPGAGIGCIATRRCLVKSLVFRYSRRAYCASAAKLVPSGNA